MSIEVCFTYPSSQCFIMAYPNGKAMNDATISRSKYSLKNKFKMTFTLAPFTFRIAISFRRCSHDNVTKENMPNTAITMQIRETTLSNLLNVFSDFMYSL